MKHLGKILFALVAAYATGILVFAGFTTRELPHQGLAYAVLALFLFWLPFAILYSLAMRRMGWWTAQVVVGVLLGLCMACIGQLGYVQAPASSGRVFLLPVMGLLYWCSLLLVVLIPKDPMPGGDV